MVNIYSYLKNAIQNLIKESKNNPFFGTVLLVFISIPFGYAINSVALAILFLVSIFTFKKQNVSFSKELLISVFLYLIMLSSYFWSIDVSSTQKGIITELPLLIIPIVFILSKKITSFQLYELLKYYSYFILIVALFFLTRAMVRFSITHDSRVFFYHGEDTIDFGLVPKLLNAIHVSVYVSISFFYFLSHEIDKKKHNLIAFFLFFFILLLSSKNIIITVAILTLVYLFFFSKSSYKMRLRNLIVLVLIIGFIISFGKIKNRFKVEFQTNSKESINPSVVEGVPAGVHYVSIYEAWNNKTFTPNDYFPGTAFRVYQFRVFVELMSEHHNYLNGFGLWASSSKIEKKAIDYNLYLGKDGKEGYQNKNFHNQYIQNFAELGILGFVLLLLMLFFSFKNAIKSKDFIHFAFSILMISLFLTESFLWRQRGVVFFVLMYCLFNSKTLNQNSLKKNQIL